MNLELAGIYNTYNSKESMEVFVTKEIAKSFHISNSFLSPGYLTSLSN